MQVLYMTCKTELLLVSIIYVSIVEERVLRFILFLNKHIYVYYCKCTSERTWSPEEGIVSFEPRFTGDCLLLNMSVETKFLCKNNS